MRSHGATKTQVRRAWSLRAPAARELRERARVAAARVASAGPLARAAAARLDERRLALRLPPHIKVPPCRANDRDSVKNVLLELLEVILQRSDDE